MASTEIKSSESTSGAFVLLHERDNILVCSQSAPAGSVTEIDGHPIMLAEDIPLGHKIARKPIARGEKVLRYGIAIGSMSADVAAGAHVHSHNLQSDYIPAHGRNASRIQEIRS